MKDLWAEMAEAEVIAPPSGGGSDIPDKMRFIVKNTTEANGKAAPTVAPVGSGDNVFYRLSTGLIIVGGEPKGEAYKGRYIFLRVNTNKPRLDQYEQWRTMAEAKGQEGNVKRLDALIKGYDKLPLNPELYNFLLDVLSPEGKDTQERYRAAMAQLTEMKNAKGYTVEAFQGDVQLLTATLFKDLLLVNEYKVIGSTYTPKAKEGSDFVPSQTLGSIESCTEAKMTQRRVKLYATDEF